MKKRTLVRRPYPQLVLEDALTIARTIQEANSGLSCDRVLLAKALNTTPDSSGFVTKLNASSKYGLTEGGYRDTSIDLTDRGISVVSPTSTEGLGKGLINAALEPEIFRSFYTKLDGKRLPEDSFSKNVLERELGVPESLTEECLGIIVKNGLAVGILGEVSGSLYVSVSGVYATEQGSSESGNSVKQPELQIQMPAEPASSTAPGEPGSRKVFIGHAGNSDVVDQLKAVIEPFGIRYEVVDSDYDATRPLTSDVSDKMRECHAAILIMAPASDQVWKGRREDKRTQKMAYMLGAASAFYGDRFLVLVESSFGISDDNAFESLEFRSDRPGEMGFGLLAQLHSIGVIRVST